MSNYIIAGEAGSMDLAECEFLGKKLEASTPSVHVHVIAKHNTEWDAFLKKICSGYGFKESSSPIIFTVEGKLVGDKHAFKEHVLQTYSVKGELDKNMKALISEYDRVSLENHRQKIADGPHIREITKNKLDEVVKDGSMRVIDGFFQPIVDQGFEFFVKKSHMLSPFAYEDFNQWAENLDFFVVPELSSERPAEEIFDQDEIKVTEEEDDDDEEENQHNAEEDEEQAKIQKEILSEIKEPEKKTHNSAIETPLMTNQDDDPEASLINYEVDDKNIKKFIEYFTSAKPVEAIQEASVEVPVPVSVKSIFIPNSNVIRDLPKDFLLALNIYPLIPGEMVIFSGKMTEGGWLLRDASMMQNWLKLITIPPQRPVYKDGELIEPTLPKESFHVKDLSGSCLKHRGYTYKNLDLSLECSRNTSLKLNTINIMIRHILTETDWEVWYKTVKELDAIGYYQLLPYGEMK